MDEKHRKLINNEPVYQRGFVEFHITPQAPFNPADCVFGVQVHEDGRVWMCINGVTFLRFKPNGQPMPTYVNELSKPDHPYTSPKHGPFKAGEPIPCAVCGQPRDEHATRLN